MLSVPVETSALLNYHQYARVILTLELTRTSLWKAYLYSGAATHCNSLEESL